MSESQSMNDTQHALYARILQFTVDEGGEQLTFARRLARENGWTAEYTARAMEEYKRFMFLAVEAGHPVTPSDQVDQVWHLHLTYTRSYWERFCGEVLQRPIHHGPTKGGREEGRKFHDWYEKTRDSYRQFFDESPPIDLWPEPAVRFGDDVHFERINTRRNWVIAKPWRRASQTVMAAALLPIGVGLGGVTFLGAQWDVDGIPVVYLLFGVLALFWLITRIFSGGGKGGGSGGGGWFGCGGGDSGCGGGDSGCGGGDSGCGGGGCGGGGCGGCGGD